MSKVNKALKRAGQFRKYDPLRRQATALDLLIAVMTLTLWTHVLAAVLH